MRDTLKSTIVKVKAFQLPSLPRDLQSRKREVLDLFKGLEAKRRNNDHVAPGINPPTFEEALRMYYPKDTKGQISILVKWVNEVMSVKAEAAEARSRGSHNAYAWSIGMYHMPLVRSRGSHNACIRTCACIQCTS